MDVILYIHSQTTFTIASSVAARLPSCLVAIYVVFALEIVESWSLFEGRLEGSNIWKYNIDGKLVYAATWPELEFLYIRVNDDIQFGDTHGGPPGGTGWILDGRRWGYLGRKFWRSK